MASRSLPVPWLAAAFLIAGCSLELDPPTEVIHARFDPEEGVIPMPTDILRDGEAGHLDLPTDDEELTAAETEFYGRLNRMDGWPSTFPASLEFSGPVSEDTLTEDTVQVWRWGEEPVRVTDLNKTTARAGTELTIDPPEDGWLPGHRYVVLVRGGPDGVLGRMGQRVEPDPAFYFVRLKEKLDEPGNNRAFPGSTRDERMEKARDLEEVRLELSPYFDYFESIHIPRAEIAALWTFTATAHAELAMDQTTHRVPLPFDLLLDPSTGLVELPSSPDDSELEASAKRQVNGLDGFALSATLMFEFSQFLDPETVSGDSIKLYELDDALSQIPVQAWLMADGKHVVVEPEAMPLREHTTYALVVYEGLTDRAGKPVIAMPMGYFLLSESAIALEGKSQIGSLSDHDALRVEGVRRKIAPLLSAVNRDQVVAAWPFTTQSVLDPLLDRVDSAAALQVSPDPTVTERKSAGDAVLDFPLGIGSIASVGDVYYGTIQSPVFLDRVTRSFREDGGYEIENVPFIMTLPSDASEPLPVVLFGHGLMTEMRFLLAVGDFLARRGFAGIAIDLPYHGTRTHCKRGGPMSIPHWQTGELIDLDPCQSGTTCAVDGRCVDAFGEGNALAYWPVVGFPMASGAAFLEIEEIASTRDHFAQALIDLRSLLRSLKEGDWEGSIGTRLDTEKFYYVGQSLGGILGGTFVSITPEIDRAVLNVPGCDLVDMFTDSPYFGMQVDAFFTREDLKWSTYEAELFFNVARWLVDSVDPHSVAHRMKEDDRKALIQMATLDFIISNPYTIKLQEISGLPMREYFTEHAFLTIVLDPFYLPGVIDMADFIAGEIDE